ncbi:DUF2807 domain-containing protein [Niveispirillum sp. BGYR6]|uniref:GIN domain-containing protein n=1 Tax=Niveispirillum sp. BGYR6 TaxID=2971249 RepID=UPI0022B96668|nr:DUF2807 domain-containing protein [Niveispirillum sp. BGYR6]MDG5495210.1 DUF2807 domain-containing protein [Niveispirillum sp. BGYR6]
MSPRNLLLATALCLLPLPAFAFGPQGYDASAVKIDGVYGKLDVTVANTDKVTVEVTGPEKRLAEVTVNASGGTLVIEQKNSRNGRDWRDKDDQIQVTIRLPAGTGLEIEDFIGDGKVGDLRGPLEVDDIVSGSLTIGHVTTAKLSVSGSGKIKVGDIDRTLDVEINGSGSVATGSTQGEVKLEINGSGDIDIARVNGPVAASVNGSGDIHLRAGTADPLAASIAGSGQVTLDGVARNQAINNNGSGSVKVTGRAS